MGTKDSLYMQHKNIELCPLCEYAVYDAIGEKGWNCNNHDSRHYNRNWNLIMPTECNCFQFATGSCKKWVEHEIKKAEAKAQTTLGDF